MFKIQSLETLQVWERLVLTLHVEHIFSSKVFTLFVQSFDQKEIMCVHFLRLYYQFQNHDMKG